MIKKYISLFVISLAIWIIILFYLPPDYDKLNIVHRLVVSRINSKWEYKILQLSTEKRAVIDYRQFINYLNPVERNLADRILSINPRDIGFKGAFITTETCSNLEMINNVTLEAFDDKGITVETGVQYYPKDEYPDFVKMMSAMMKDINKRLYVCSGYRSAGKQMFLFFYYLQNEADYSLRKNATFVAMPGYSEHNAPKNTAMDLINIKGISGEGKLQNATTFATLEEYSWLTKNAKKYNFALSYPAGNLFGVTFEPWHWHHCPN